MLGPGVLSLVLSFALSSVLSFVLSFVVAPQGAHTERTAILHYAALR